MVSEQFEKGDHEEIDKYLFGRALATRLESGVKATGPETRATNILGSIDRMVKLNKNYRVTYDDLSEVTHPNRNGVLFHFAELTNDEAIFHDGELKSQVALANLIRTSFMFVCAEPAIHELDEKLDLLWWRNVRQS